MLTRCRFRTFTHADMGPVPLSSRAAVAFAPRLAPRSRLRCSTGVDAVRPYVSPPGAVDGGREERHGRLELSPRCGKDMAVPLCGIVMLMPPYASQRGAKRATADHAYAIARSVPVHSSARSRTSRPRAADTGQSVSLTVFRISMCAASRSNILFPTPSTQ